MRHIVSNSDLLKMWANQSQDSASNAGRSYSFEGPELKSYSTPIAYYTKNAAGVRCALIDCWNHSNTTARHKPKPRDIPAGVRVLYVNGLRGFYRCRTNEEIAAFIADSANHFIAIYENLRNSTRAADRYRARVARQYADDLRDFFGLQMQPQTQELEAA